MIEQGRLQEQADRNSQGRPPAENDADQAIEEEKNAWGTHSHVNQRRHGEGRRHQGDPGSLLIPESPGANESQEAGEQKAARQPRRGKNSVGDVDCPGQREEMSSDASHKPSSVSFYFLG